MAIIYTYPQKTTLSSDDLLLLSDSTSTPTNNITKSATLGSLASFIGGGVSGSGITNTLPIWSDGPNGALGDSIITQAASGQGVTITGQLDVTEDFYASGSTQLNGALTVQGVSSFNDDVTFEEGANFQNAVYDQSSNQGTAGQVLSSTGSNVEWVDPSSSITKLVPTIFVGTPGGSDTFSTNHNIVELQWVGGNGIYVLNIPSATDIPYRKIRFAIDGSFPGGSNHRINITAQSGETIDGISSFQLNRTYEGAAIWSNGTEWIVIQLKG